MKRVTWGVAAFLLAVVLMGCATAQRGTMIQARSNLDEGNYKEALGKLADAEKMVAPTPELQAEIVYLRAEAYEGLGRKDEAVGALKYLVDKFPDSSYAYQAKERLRKLAE
jgi:outer membrane protein assembly factor BamD (BamD/ComL family)